MEKLQGADLPGNPGDWAAASLVLHPWLCSPLSSLTPPE